MFQYDCPECGNAVKLAREAEPGQKLRCPVCQEVFSPRAETLAFAADDPPARPKPAKAPRPAAKPAKAAKPAAAPAPTRPKDDDDDVNPYGVVKETEEERLLAEKNKPKFGDVADKFKKSSRGPASALLVLPTNLLIGEGALTGLGGLGAVIVGLWPLVFTDAPPSDEEVAEQVVLIFAGLVALLWAAIVCVGASRMQNLESYSWAMIGAVFGIVPLLAGIFAIIALRDKRVIAGFEEMEGALDEDEDEEKDDDDEDEDDED